MFLSVSGSNFGTKEPTLHSMKLFALAHTQPAAVRTSARPGQHFSISLMNLYLQDQAEVSQQSASTKIGVKT